jgi:RecA-family ATPase
MSQPKEIDWVIDGFIHRKGLLVTFGPAGVGKSQLLLRACEAMSTGRDFLKWRVVKPMKMLYISLEMPDEELYHFLTTMKMTDNPLLQTNFMVMPLGLSIKIGSGIAKEHLNRVVEKFQPDGIIIDSFIKAVGDDINNTKVVIDVIDYVDTYLRLKYGCFVWFIHHPRKGQPNNKRPDKLDDMFGASYLGNSATNVFTLWKGNSDLLKVNCLKLRMAAQFEPFNIRRTSNLDFEVIKEIGRKNTDEVIWGSENTIEKSI